MDAVATLFEITMYLPIALAALGAAVLLAGLFRGDKRVRLGGAVVLAVGLVWLAANVLVTTTKEQAHDRTLAVFETFEAEDWPAFDNLIDPDTRLAGALVGPQIGRAAREVSDYRGGGEDVRVVDSEATRVGDNAYEVRVQVTADVQTNVTDSIGSAWMFHYTLRGDRLVLDRIEPLRTPLVDPETVRRYVGRYR